MKIRNLQSLLVCSIILWKSSLARVQWTCDWRSWLASRIQSCVWCLAFTCYMRWCVWICKNVSRYTMCVPNASLRLGTISECLSIPSGTGGRGNDTGRLLTWGFPLRIDSASWDSFASFIQFTSFYNSVLRQKIPLFCSDRRRIFVLPKCRMWNSETSLIHFNETSLMNFTKVQILLQNLSLKKSLLFFGSNCLKIVLMNSCLAFCNNLLFLIVEKSFPNLCFWTFVLTESSRSLSNWLPCSIGHWRRQTDRQVFSY